MHVLHRHQLMTLYIGDFMHASEVGIANHRHRANHIEETPKQLWFVAELWPDPFDHGELSPTRGVRDLSDKGLEERAATQACNLL